MLSSFPAYATLPTVDVDRGLPRTVDGIADVPVGRAAWLRDPDGNVIGLVEFQGHG